MTKKKSASSASASTRWQVSWLACTFACLVLGAQIALLRKANNLVQDLGDSWVEAAKLQLETWTTQKRMDLEAWSTNKIDNILQNKLETLDISRVKESLNSVLQKRSEMIDFWTKTKVHKLMDERLDERLGGLEVWTSDKINSLVDSKLLNKLEPTVFEILKKNIDCNHRTKRSSGTAEDNNVGPHVEFFNPKLRGELQAKGELAPGGDSWVWLTSYSRIPYQVVQGFCKATQEYCPPGVQGPPGLAGPRGPRGERGGPGPKGDTGFPGHSGLDGRDGVPGEPGLDGVPGRSGADGAPGMNGKDGNNGSDGRNGVDGKAGGPGPPGPAGPTGSRGLSGPRGRAGRAGTDGSPGLPGISAWIHNNTQTLLIPPSIAVGGETVVVHENESVHLRCVTTGQPPPSVQWSRAAEPLHTGAWRSSGVAAATLDVPRASRLHQGEYSCTAHNGVPPQATKTYRLEVHFSPMIRIKNQMIPARNGSTVQLECEVEAFPEPLRYWERADGRLLEPADRFRTEITPSSTPYRTYMKLKLMRLHHQDIGQYNCIAKNELGMTKGVFTIYEQDPSLGTPPPVDSSMTGESGAQWGPPVPPTSNLEDICPPATTCPACARCSDPALSLADLLDHLRVEPLGGKQYKGLPARTTDCQLYAIGKPVYHRYSEYNFGSWLRDSTTTGDPGGDKIWVTRETDTKHLFEFSNKSAFRKDQPTKTYMLEFDYVGNGHIVYNGSFFYHAGKRRLIRAELGSRGKAGGGSVAALSIDLPEAAEPPSRALYATAHTFMDFSADDNGLWVIYAMNNSNNTAVAKIDPDNLQAQYIWNISVNHHKVGEMFIVCGVLYAVDSATERTTRVRLAFDLYQNKLLEVALPFTNPFRKTTVLAYNHRNRELYSWDRGNQLTYPVRYHEMGHNSTLALDSGQAQQAGPPDEDTVH